MIAIVTNENTENTSTENTETENTLYRVWAIAVGDCSDPLGAIAP